MITERSIIESTKIVSSRKVSFEENLLIEGDNLKVMIAHLSPVIPSFCDGLIGNRL